MPSEKILKSKQQYVADLAEQMKGAEAFVFVSARGLTVEQDTKMRAELRGAGVTYQVIKNSMLKRVFEELKIEGLENIFEGPTAVAYSNEVTAPAKILAKYAEDYEPLEIKGGVISGKAASVAEIVAFQGTRCRDSLQSGCIRFAFPFYKARNARKSCS